MWERRTDPRCAPAEPRDLPSIVVPREKCADYAVASELEWLETNGTGGFAMGTVSGANTRRYHGLLVASLAPPVERYVLLSKLDEAVEQIDIERGGRWKELSANQYPGVVHPDGYLHMTGFRLDPFPTWSYRVGNLEIEKRLFMVRGEQMVVVLYRASARCRLRVTPLIAFRDYHGLTRANPYFDTRVTARRDSVVFHPYAGLPAIRLYHSAGSFVEDGAWHYDVEYLRELDRGLDFREDLYRPGHLELTLEPSAPSWVVAAAGAEQTRPVAERIFDWEQAERARRRSQFRDPLVARLESAADQFLVHRADGSPTAIAGYPWFTDWGRDTMIGIPGLLIARGHLEAAREVIRGFLQHLNRGIIPNRFPDRGAEPEYNTADATLWMFIAVHAYLEAGGDPAFVRDEFYPAGFEIIRHHQRGTHHGIAVDPADGLVIAGHPGTQLTWMDARVDGRVITPRHGKAIEINALYYNALRLLADWGRLGDRADDVLELEAMAARMKASFEAKFWNDERRCLFDVVREDGNDTKIRPNQLFALSLPYPLISPERQRAVVDVVERELLTHVGLRTLSPADPDYQPRYRGGPQERDAAYHQGVVWPWLLGPFVRAYLRAYGRTGERIAYCRALFRGLELHLSEACLGSVSELFEAEPPFRPVGAPAQAWSVSELLEVLSRELSDDGAARGLREQMQVLTDYRNQPSPADV